MGKKTFLALSLIVIISVLLQGTVLGAPPSVVLVSPGNDNISSNNNITFICNASDVVDVYNVSLFNDINGTFSLYTTKLMLETSGDANTTLLCRFDGTYVCQDGENGTATETDLTDTRFKQGVKINDTDTLTYPTSGNLNYDRGSLEFWVRPGYNTDDSLDEADLFSTESLGEGNRISLYIEFPNALKFEFRDNNNAPLSAEQSVNWNDGEWHHVALLWDIYNGTDIVGMVDLFVDGTNSSTSYGGSYGEYGAAFGTNMYMGSSNSGLSQQSAVYDEFIVFNRLLNASEIWESYTKGTLNHLNESVNWTISNVTDGFYKWACLAYNNQSEGAWSSNYTFYVDAISPPVVNSITLSPSSTDDIDPNMNISVTANVTDYSNVSYVVFQWKITEIWTNDTMDCNNVTGLYENATINIDQGGGVYIYRIWSNDTSGHSGYSSTYNVTASLDYTWNNVPSDFGTVYGLICSSEDENRYVGTLIINNTGDASLSFIITDDWLLAVNFNTTNSFSLNAKEVKHINVTAQFASAASDNNMKLNITASRGGVTPVPVYSEITANLISTAPSGGPYFDDDDITIFTYPTSAYHSTQYNLSAKLKNIGNETATEVWINWTLPTGWSLVSGNLSLYVGNLNGTALGDNTAWNNVTVLISPSTAAAGVQNLSVAAASNNSLSANATVSVYVVCNSDDSVCGSGCSYVTDDDCIIPQQASGGSTITSISGLTKEYKFSMAVPSRIDVNRGESTKFRVGINNTVSGTKLTIDYFYISGYPQTFISFTPSSLAGIPYNGMQYFDVEIKAPTYAVYNEYNLDITAKGRFYEGNKTNNAEKSAKVTLVTHKTITNETAKYLESAETAVSEMQGAGFDTEKISALADQLKKAVDDGKYDVAKELSESIMQTKQSAFSTENKIRETEEKIVAIKSQNFALPESERMIRLAKAAFMRGEYDRAEERVTNALIVYAAESVNANMWISFYNSAWIIAAIAVALATVAFMGKKSIMRSSLSRTMTDLSSEEKKIYELMEKLQKDHFVDKKIGDETYERNLKNFESAIMENKNKRMETLRKLMEISGKEAVIMLSDEEKRLKNAMADMQRKYFEQNKIGKYRYTIAMKGFKEELIEIERLKDMTEAGHV